MAVFKIRVGDGDGDGDDDDDGDGDGRISPEHPSPILHAPRDIISRKGKSLTPTGVLFLFLDLFQFCCSEFLPELLLALVCQIGKMFPNLFIYIERDIYIVYIYIYIYSLYIPYRALTPIPCWVSLSVYSLLRALGQTGLNKHPVDIVNLVYPYGYPYVDTTRYMI